MLSRNRAESNTHDGICTCSKYIQLTILNKVTMRISNLMFERKTYATTFTNPVLLHRFDALRPTQAIQTREELFCIGRDIEVVTRNLTFLN